jgi:hypothetical protein
MVPVEVRSRTILHLSDLHFGDDHGFPTDPQRLGMGTDVLPLWQLISYRLTRQLNA